MQQPPTVLTPKDCQYIEDILNHSLNLVKKTNLYFEILKKYINLNSILEFSIECNPKDISIDLINLFKENNDLDDNDPVFISHGDSIEDAEFLKQLI